MAEIIAQEINDKYALYNADAMDVMVELPPSSVHLSIYSPPFATATGGLYRYSSSERDLSNCVSYEQFFEHYGFVVAEIARLTMPGRMTAVHCMDVPLSNTGRGDARRDFPGDIIRLHAQHGFAYVARYCVWKEPLTVRNRTMTKSLAHKTIVDDSSRCSNASADYLLVFRNKGENPAPITHPHGLTEYAGARAVPAELLRYRTWKGNQIENRYSHWIWRQYACYSSDTEVLTRSGWKLHQDVSLDDEICCFNPQTDTQEWQRPSRIHAFPFIGDMINIRGGEKAPLDLLVTPNHRMLVKPNYPLPVGSKAPYKNPRHWAFRAASTLSTSKWKVPYAVGEDATGHGGDVTFARFLGWWISEGSLAYGAPVLTQAVGEVSERMRGTVAEMGYEANYLVQDTPPRQPCMHLRLRGATVLGRWLREQCGDTTYSKHIPKCAFSWSPEARRILLDALIDGDGTRHTEERFSYSTTSCQLADDVQVLAISLGYSARITTYFAPNEGRAPRYCINIGPRKYVTIQPRNFSTVPYAGTVYCLTVPTGAYVTRRNGRMAVAGNSAFWDDVRLDRVLPFRESRDEEDEKHVHPLQLDVIDRCLVLWSNPGEIVLSPFAGVGSEVYAAVRAGRFGLGVELKSTYWRQAVKNVKAALSEASADPAGLFDSLAEPRANAGHADAGAAR